LVVAIDVDGPAGRGTVVETAGTVVAEVIVSGFGTVVVEVTTGVSASGTVVSAGADALRITSCTGRDAAGEPPRTNAAAHIAASPRSPPQARQVRRARRCWRLRSTSGSSTNLPPT
jgi:hypothetical protein